MWMYHEYTCMFTCKTESVISNEEELLYVKRYHLQYKKLQEVNTVLQKMTTVISHTSILGLKKN